MKYFVQFALLLAVIVGSPSYSFSGKFDIHLRDKEEGKTYRCKTDKNGRFLFEKVRPGTYELIWLIREGYGEIQSCEVEITNFFTEKRTTGAKEVVNKADVHFGNAQKGEAFKVTFLPEKMLTTGERFFVIIKEGIVVSDESIVQGVCAKLSVKAKRSPVDDDGIKKSTVH